MVTRSAMTPAGRFDLLRRFDSLLTDFEPRLADSLSASILSGYFSGAETSLAKIPVDPAQALAAASFGAPPQKPPDLPGLLASSPDEGPRVELTALAKAAERLSQRRVLTPDDYYKLAGAAKEQAFTITADISADARDKLHRALSADLSEGTSFTGFRASVLDEFDRLPISESHLEQVYRNNVNESFSQGMDHVLNNPLVEDEFPYRLYVAIHDARARPEHRELEHLGLNGTAVYFKDDPTWMRFRPPWSWGCRCGWIPLSIADAARRGVQEAIEWQRTGIEPEHRFVPSPTFSPPAGWDRTALGVAA
jgi:hypothetical protein